MSGNRAFASAWFCVSRCERLGKLRFRARLFALQRAPNAPTENRQDEKRCEHRDHEDEGSEPGADARELSKPPGD